MNNKLHVYYHDCKHMTDFDKQHLIELFYMLGHKDVYTVHTQILNSDEGWTHKHIHVHVNLPFILELRK